MINFFYNTNPAIQTLIAAFIAFLFNLFGAGTIFFFKRDIKNKIDILLSIAAGIMLASTFFSLIIPALTYSANNIKPAINCATGILIGSIVLFIGERIYNSKNKNDDANNIVFSIILHNFPEGIAIGVAFGAAACGLSTIASALAISLGIALQNFPEGGALSFILFKKGYKKTNAFFTSCFSSLIEVIGALIGIILALKLKLILPLLLSFAAGAMLYVIVVELIPESMQSKHKEKMAIFLVLGFVIMMIFDVILG